MLEAAVALKAIVEPGSNLAQCRALQPQEKRTRRHAAVSQVRILPGAFLQFSLWPATR
jgi:hypothetical protein